MNENFHEVWIKQQRLINKAMDHAQPLLDSLRDAIAHAPEGTGHERLDRAHRHLATSLNREAAAFGLGRVLT